MPFWSKADPAVLVTKATLAELQSTDHWLGLAEDFGLNLLGGLLVFFGGLWLARRLSKALDRALTRAQTEITLRGFLRNISYGAMVVVVAVAALQAFGIPSASIFAVLGAAGLAIGLALKDSLSNVASGVMLIVQHPFRAGDHVLVAGQEGTVEQVRVFQTRLRTVDNRSIVLPNSLITSAAIINFTANTKRRIDISVSVGFNENLEAARSKLVELANANSKVMREPAAEVLLIGIAAENRVTMELRAWVKTADVPQARSELTEAVRDSMIQLAVGMPPGPRDLRVFHHNADGQPLVELWARSVPGDADTATLR